VEYYAGGIGLTRMTGGRPAREVVEGVIAGDPRAMELFDVLIGELALGLCTAIILFKPEVIAIGGGISVVGDYLLRGIREKVYEYRGRRSNDYDTNQIKLAVHGNNAGMIGAAVLAELYLNEDSGKK
jgi:glucokinase